MKRQAFFAVILMIVCLMVTVAFAASFTSTYDTATPLGTDAPSVLDNRIREVKAAVQERLNIEHVFDLTGTEVSHANSGQHTAINCTSVTSTGAISGTTITGTGGLTGTTLAASGNATVGGTLDVTGVATLGDASLLATSAAPSTDAMIANKKYVDDQVDTQNMTPATYVSGESVTFANGLIFKHGSVSSIGANSQSTVTFGTAFPTSIDAAFVTLRDSVTSHESAMSVKTLAVGSMVVVNHNSFAEDVYWQAWGR